MADSASVYKVLCLSHSTGEMRNIRFGGQLPISIVMGILRKVESVPSHSVRLSGLLIAKRLPPPPFFFSVLKYTYHKLCVHVRMYAFIWMGAGAHTCRYVWRPEIDIGCFPLVTPPALGPLSPESFESS